MIQQSISWIAAAIFSCNYHGTANAVNPVPSNSEALHQAQKVENKELAAYKLKEFFRLHWVDLEYLTTISITCLAILIGTGSSLKHQKSTSQDKQTAVQTLHTEDLKTRNSTQISGNIPARINETQTTEPDPLSQESLSVEVKPLALTDKQSLEQQESHYRKKYEQLQKLVGQLSRVANTSTWNINAWEVDVEVARIVLLESLGEQQEVYQVLRQSDRALNWEISLPDSEYQAKVSEYIEKIYHSARTQNLNKLRPSNLSKDQHSGTICHS